MHAYTIEEVRRLAETDPAKLAEEYRASRAATKNLGERAKAGILARTPVVPKSRFVRWAQGYGRRWVDTGSFRPFVHIMLIVGSAGVFTEWWCHHRPAQQAKEAKAKAAEHH